MNCFTGGELTKMVGWEVGDRVGVGVYGVNGFMGGGLTKAVG